MAKPADARDLKSLAYEILYKIRINMPEWRNRQTQGT